MEKAGRTARVVRFGVFEADLRAGELRKHGLRIRLQEKPFQVLATLLERPADLVTRDELRMKLWAGDTFVDFDHSINIAINKLREALSDSAENPRFIETLARRGYRFIGPVESLEVENSAQRAPAAAAGFQPLSAAAPSATAAPGREAIAPDAGPQAAELTAPAPTVKSAIQAPWPRLIVRPWRSPLGLAAATVVLVAAAYLIWKLVMPMPLLPAKLRLVVLPFDNLNRDQEQEYFSDGLTDETIAQLASLDADRLGVIARTSAMMYKHTKKNVPQIARELGVQYALEGTVYRAGDRVRITARLIQCSDQTHLWAESYESDLRDILALQSAVARAVADEIQIKLSPKQRARLVRSSRAVKPEAYEAYLRGRFYWNKRGGEGLAKAIEYFEQAIKQDPNYALAYAGLAASYSLLGAIPYDVLPPREAIPKARAAAIKALELEDLAEAHTSLAYIKCAYEWNWAEAEKEFRRAIEINRGYATAHQWYAWYLAAMGRLDEASTESRHAYDLDPLSLVIGTQIALTSYLARDYDRAIEQCQKTLELDPNHLEALYVLGRAYDGKGMYAKAISELQKGKALSGGSPAMTMAVGHAYAASGNRAEAQKAIDELKVLAQKRYVPALYIAPIYGRLGEKDEAMRWLEKAYEERSDYLLFLKREPLADPVRSDARFQALVRRIGLPR